MKRLSAMLILACALCVPLSLSVVAREASDDRQTQADIEALVAPVALYPDTLLSQVLIAATYPLEIVRAADWSRAQSGLSGVEAVSAAADQDWDESVKALVAFPDLLLRMSEDLNWTAQLGNAFLFQEADLMDAVQTLRQRAESAGYPGHGDHVDLVRDQDALIIRSRTPDVVYVPHYDPVVLFGSAYHDRHWPRGWHRGRHFRHGIGWSGAVSLRGGFFFSYIDWGGRHVRVIHGHRPRQRLPYHYGRGYLREGGHAPWREERAWHDRSERPDRDRGMASSPSIRLREQGRGAESRDWRRQVPSRVTADRTAGPRARATRDRQHAGPSVRLRQSTRLPGRQDARFGTRGQASTPASGFRRPADRSHGGRPTRSGGDGRPGMTLPR